MSRHLFKQPPRYTRDELVECVTQAEAQFVRSRLTEDGDAEALGREKRLLVKALFDDTDNLRHLSTRALLKDWRQIEVLRYCSIPPISEDNLATFVGRKMREPPTTERARASYVDALDHLVALIPPYLDRARFPWLAEGRPASEYERSVAIEITVALIVSETLRTRRRNEGRDRLESSVAKSLVLGGLERVDVPVGGIRLIDTLKKGTFTSEASVSGHRADVPARLRDGRLLLIECKDSNTEINSLKRLNREAAAKATIWYEAYGREQIIVVAALSGVFRAENVWEAQESSGLTIMWEHDLRRLEMFVSACL